MLHRIRLAAVAAVALLAACSGPEIDAQRDTTVPIPATPTWAWGRRDTVSQYELDPAVASNPMLHQRVGTAIEANLTRRGWHKVEDPSQATLLVTYHIGLKRESAMQTTGTDVGVYGGNRGWYGGYGWGYYGAPAYYGGSTTTETIHYNTGGLLIYVREASTGRVAWHGLFKKDVHDVLNIPEENIRTAVDATLKQLRH